MAGRLVPLPKNLEYLEDKIKNHKELTDSDLKRFHKKATRLNRDFFKISGELLTNYENFYNQPRYHETNSQTLTKRIKNGFKFDILIASPVLFYLTFGFIVDSYKPKPIDYLGYAASMAYIASISIAICTPLKLLYSYLKHYT